MSFDRIIDALWVGFEFRGGETCDGRGKSRVGASLFAINESWTDRAIRYPHRRAIGEWLDELHTTGFDAAAKRKQLRQQLERKRVGLHPKVVDEFVRMERGFGSWRTPDLKLNLGVAVLAPSLLAAKFWGDLFDQTHPYDLASKRVIALADVIVPSVQSGF